MKHPVLILNLDYQAFDIWEWQHAISKLLCCKNVGPVYNENGMISYNKKIRDGSGNEYDLPAILILKKYIKTKNHLATYTKFNIYARDLGYCQYCGIKTTPQNRTIDHIIPRSKWKDYKCDFLLSSFENVVTCCTQCNIKKGDSIPKHANMNLLNIPRKITRLQAYKNKLIMLPNKPKQWHPYLKDKNVI